MEARVLIIGGGIAGSTAALGLADSGIDVVMVRPSTASEVTASFHAQGGIVYKGKDDSPESRAEDIWNAGGRCGNREMIRLIAESGPEAVERLLLGRLAISFDKTPDHGLSLTREAAHSCARIIHSRDATGKTIMKALHQSISDHPGITCLNGCTASELITSRGRAEQCNGALIITRGDGVKAVRASVTIMATGGTGALYKRTSNPEGSRGHGLAMASRAGARIKDLEYIQFHPTALSLPGTEPFLISEAVRGAGARLVNSSNIPFMDKYSPDWKDLAPRDVVTRAICSEMKTENTSNVFLNFFDYISAGEIENRFPTIYNHCRNYGVDITKELLPVAPASHFSCGGIEVDSWAQSSLQGFYALGECSCTGVHGANRLASTSLLEGVVWADRAVRSISENLRDQSADLLPDPSVSVNPGDPGDFPGSNQDVKCQIQKLEDEIQRIMWDKVGIIRNRDDLSGAVEELGAVKSAAEQLYSQGLPTEGTAGLRNMAGAAMVIAEAALWNRVSRGCHFVVS